MASFVRGALARFGLVCLLIGVGTLPTQADPLKLTIWYDDQPLPPFIVEAGEAINWSKPGITLEILKSLEPTLGVTLELVAMPWGRGLTMLEQNQIDGLFHASFKPERLKIGVYPMQADKPDPTRKIMTALYVLYKHQDSPLQWDGSHFTNLNGEIGATIKFSIVDDLKKMGVTVYEAPSLINKLRMLEKGRLAAVTTLDMHGDAVLKEYAEELKDVVKMEKPLSYKDYYLMFSHRFYDEHREVAEKIWSEFAKVRESPVYRQIAAKYVQ